MSQPEPLEPDSGQEEEEPILDKLLSLIDKAKTAIAMKDYVTLADTMIKLYDTLEAHPSLGVDEELSKLPPDLLEKAKENKEIRNLLENAEEVPVDVVDFVLPSEDLTATSEKEVVEEGNELVENVTKKRSHYYAQKISSLRREFNIVLNQIARNYNTARGSKGRWIIKPWLSKKEIDKGLEELEKILQSMLKTLYDHLVKKYEQWLKRLVQEGRITDEMAQMMMENIKNGLWKELVRRYYITVYTTKVPAGLLYLDKLKSLLGSYVVLGDVESGLTPPVLISYSRNIPNREKLLNYVREALVNHYKSNYYKMKEVKEFLDSLEERINGIKRVLEDIEDTGVTNASEDQEEKKRDEERKDRDLLPA